MSISSPESKPEMSPEVRDLVRMQTLVASPKMECEREARAAREGARWRVIHPDHPSIG